MAYTVARYRELPEWFERKLWLQGREGLVITTGISLALTNLLDLSSIAMLGSAVFLIVYGAVMIAHLRLLHETGAKKWIVIAALVGVIATIGVLFAYLVQTNVTSLYVLAGAIVVSVGIELLMHTLSGRHVKESGQRSLRAG